MNTWLTLLQCPGLGIAKLTKLRQYLSSLTELTTLPSKQLLQLGLSKEQSDFLSKTPSSKRNNDICSYLNEHQIELISIEDTRFPTLLRETSRPPIVLFAQGNITLLNQAQLAFVGTRTPSPYGHEVTKYLVQELSSKGIVITSGLALGIDGTAHKTALSCGGKTIAVMGSGHGDIYPKRHQNLAKEILQNDGLLLSEFLPFAGPKPFHFPQRNRIIAGISLGTVVVEAAVKSGSLITAKYALEANRDVFAVPGNIFNEISTGCHELIQNGAKLVNDVADILEELNKDVMPLQSQGSLFELENDFDKNNLAECKLLASVDHEATPVDVISQRINLPVEQVLTSLLNLELQGHINAVPGGYMRLKY